MSTQINNAVVDFFVDLQLHSSRKGKRLFLNEAPDNFMVPAEIKLLDSFSIDVVGVFKDEKGVVTHEEVYDSPIQALDGGADDLSFLISGRFTKTHQGNPWYPLHQTASLSSAEGKLVQLATFSGGSQ